MNNTQKSLVTKMLREASQAIRSGDKQTARNWASRAASVDLQDERPWILLGMLGSSKASMEYFLKAISINPRSKRAHQGLKWALQRGISDGTVSKKTKRIYLKRAGAINSKKTKLGFLIKFASMASFAIVLGIGSWIWGGFPNLVEWGLLPDNVSAIMVSDASEMLFETAEPSPTSTAIPSNTPAPSPTNTLEPTQTQTPVPTATLAPTETPTDLVPEVVLPGGVEKGENWIDIDLTNQTLTAYTGENAIRTFIVSTGTWEHPTVTGQYQVYVKYEAAPMSGPGYYLPGVPWIMYFYRGYGVHGTYWHDNFGTPMSHGCINMTIDDAEWMFNFSVVGTWVNVHY